MVFMHCFRVEMEYKVLLQLYPVAEQTGPQIRIDTVSLCASHGTLQRLMTFTIVRLTSVITAHFKTQLPRGEGSDKCLSTNRTGTIIADVRSGKLTVNSLGNVVDSMSSRVRSGRPKSLAVEPSHDTHRPSGYAYNDGTRPKQPITSIFIFLPRQLAPLTSST